MTIIVFCGLIIMLGLFAKVARKNGLQKLQKSPIFVVIMSSSKFSRAFFHKNYISIIRAIHTGRL